MQDMYRRAEAEGIQAVAFGDLFLQDIRDYREQQLGATKLSPLFPVWQIPTRELAQDLISAGVKAKVTCIDLAKLDVSCAGCEYDQEFLNSLPPGVDPCGENGEFHTLVYDAPVFRAPIRVEVAERFQRDGFVFADVLPA
jgi:diphthamide synthase (EF-2-diphthine--ammonia ligase)